MIFEITYSIFFTFVIFLILRYSKIGQIAGLNHWDLSVAFLIKSIASLVFIYIFTWHYGVGVLVFDSNRYILDGKILQSVFYADFGDYLKLLTGIGENEALIHEYLQQTEMWSRPFNFLNNDTKNVTRINSIIHFFSYKSIYIHFLIFNLFTLYGITQIYLFFKKYISVNSRFFFFALIIFPSLLFWGSSVLKEPLLIFSIGFFFKAISLKINSFFKTLIILISLYLLFNFKAYVVLSLLIPFLFFVQSQCIFKTKSILYSLFLTLSIVIISLLIFPNQRQSVVNYISNKQFDFDNIGRGGYFFKKEDSQNSYYIVAEDKSKFKRIKDSIIILEETKIYKFNGKLKNKITFDTYNKNTRFFISREQNLNPSNSYIRTDLIYSSQNQLIKNIPQALINALFRPFPTDTRTKFNLVQFTETCFVFALLIFAFFTRKKINRKEKSILISLVIFAISLSLIIGWTTPVAGAIVRYRIPVYLAIIIISFILFKPSEKWKNKEITS